MVAFVACLAECAIMRGIEAGQIWKRMLPALGAADDAPSRTLPTGSTDARSRLRTSPPPRRFQRPAILGVDFYVIFITNRPETAVAHNAHQDDADN